MCLKKLIKFLFSNTSEFSILHPEEGIRVGIVNIESVRKDWYSQWEVPVSEYSFWDSVKITLVPDLFAPAATISERKEMQMDPKWANPGILAHEMAHISYSLLGESNKIAFENLYNGKKDIEPLKFLFELKPYGLANDVEGHADIYRYLGKQMPEYFKVYYPLLF